MTAVRNMCITESEFGAEYTCILQRLPSESTFSSFIVIIAFYLYGLGNLPLLGPDEPRYAQVAREMFLSGDLHHSDTGRPHVV